MQHRIVMAILAFITVAVSVGALLLYTTAHRARREAEQMAVLAREQAERAAEDSRRVQVMSDFLVEVLTEADAHGATASEPRLSGLLDHAASRLEDRTLPREVEAELREVIESARKELPPDQRPDLSVPTEDDLR